MEVDGGNGVGLMAAVPMPPEGRLQVAWGPGNQLLLAAMPSIASEASSEPIAASTVRWCGNTCTHQLTDGSWVELCCGAAFGCMAPYWRQRMGDAGVVLRRMRGGSLTKHCRSSKSYRLLFSKVAQLQTGVLAQSARASATFVSLQSMLGKSL